MVTRGCRQLGRLTVFDMQQLDVSARFTEIVNPKPNKASLPELQESEDLCLVQCAVAPLTEEHGVCAWTHSRAGLEPGTSRFSTLRLNHYAARGMQLRCALAVHLCSNCCAICSACTFCSVPLLQCAFAFSLNAKVHRNSDCCNCMAKAHRICAIAFRFCVQLHTAKARIHRNRAAKAQCDCSAIAVHCSALQYIEVQLQCIAV